MNHRRAVALLVETSNAYARGILEGILSYVRSHKPWSIYLPEQERGARPPAWLKNWHGDGIVARIESEEIGAAVQNVGVPVIDISAARHVQGIPWVETDDQEISALAAEHLVERGFKNLAFCGEQGFNWSRWRRDAFEQLANDGDCRFFDYESQSRFADDYSWNHEKERMAAWIRELPKPIGVMACYDIKAQQLLDVCRELNVAVPEEIAVIGVDNDHLLCNLSDPPLSSVVPDTQRTGYRAAELLDQMMAGKHVAPQANLIKPLGIETRQSTDVLAIEDQHVATALRVIRERACDGINVIDIMQHIPVSRRVLERRFKEIIGRTPHEEIVRVKLSRVKQLLRETKLKMSAIARRTGFEHTEYLSVAFKQNIGVTPTAYRRNATFS